MNSEARLIRVHDLQNCAIGASDGDIGRVDDVYFDDHSWTVRYFVVDTGTWLPGRKVLVSPAAIQAIDEPGQRLVTGLTRRQIEASPPIDTDKPVSRQYETQYHGHYGYPPYWAGPYRWGMLPYPGAVPLAGTYPPPAGGRHSRAVVEEIAARERESADPYLRSARAVSGYAIQATDGALGHVEDYLVDGREWAIRYLIVDPRSWWPGAHVLVSPDWVTTVDWNESKVHVDASKEAVRSAPPYRPDLAAVDRAYEARLYAHYRRPGYWDRRPEDWTRRPAA
ncbi:MAG: PRC-barrel domain-containing protein [Candidatus Rokuibacteriota bacterium]